MLIIICGLPGSGKTTLSKALADKIGAIHINSDVIRKDLVRKPDKPTYSEDEKLLVYRTMAQRAQELIRSGENVVLDATFSRAIYLKILADIARRNDAPLHIIYCLLSDAEAKQRLNSRKGKRNGDEEPSDADFEVYLKMKQEFEAITERHLEINASLPIEKQLEQVLGYLDWTG